MKKFQIIQLRTLQFIEDQGRVYIETVSKEFNLSIANARERLKRYARNGWLTIDKSSKGTTYSLSINGDKRLKYLNEECLEECLVELFEDLF